jgi:hypothetical protein
MMPLWRYRVSKIARHAASSHMNDYDFKNQSRGRLIKLSPVQDRAYRDWNQRIVIAEYALQRSLDPNNNLVVDSP